MIPLRSALLVDAPAADVQVALWSADVWSRAWSGRGFAAAIPDPDRLRPGTVITLTRRSGRAPRRRAETAVRVADHHRTDGDGLAGRELGDDRRAGSPDERRRISGPTLVGTAGLLRGWTLRCFAAATRAGCLVTIDATNSGGRWRPGARRRVLLFQHLFLGAVTSAARGEARPTVVVAGVIVENGRVLAARRRYPPEVAGRWECPGGKVEPGETEQRALARELREELGITTEIGERISPSIRISADYVLHAYRARIVAGCPVAHEHDEIAWVSADRLQSVDWAPADRPLVPALQRLLAET